MTGYPITAPTIADDNAYRREIERLVQDLTPEDLVERILTEVESHVSAAEADLAGDDPYYCEDCERHSRTRYPTELNAEQRRRHDVITRLEDRIGKNAGQWYDTADEISADTLRAAVALATTLRDPALSRTEDAARTLTRTADTLTTAAQRLRELNPLLAQVRTLADQKDTP